MLDLYVLLVVVCVCVCFFLSGISVFEIMYEKVSMSACVGVCVCVYLKVVYKQNLPVEEKWIVLTFRYIHITFGNRIID